MENCIQRFPFVGEMILNNLDDQSLVRSKEISRKVSEFIRKERFYWIRIIQKYNVDLRQGIKKAPIKNLREVAVESEKSYLIKIIEGYKIYYGGYEQAWNKVVDKIPVIRQLLIAIKQFFKLHTGFVISFSTH